MNKPFDIYLYQIAEITIPDSKNMCGIRCLAEAGKLVKRFDSIWTVIEEYVTVQHLPTYRRSMVVSRIQEWRFDV